MVARQLLMLCLFCAAWISTALVSQAADPKTPKDALGSFLERLSTINTASEKPVTYSVRQIVRLDQIDKDAKTVRMWVSIPSDETNQRLLDFQVVSAPGTWKITSDAEHRGKFVLVEVANPGTDVLEVEVQFSLTREPVFVDVQPLLAGTLTDGLKAMLAEHLVLDAPHMAVTPAMQQIADEVCGEETNIATQAFLLLQHVASTVDHYSYSTDPDMPNCGIGDAGTCLKQGGGCCTDLNSLFITLARARGIPARLNMGYRLQEKNRGKLVDPGYRCWVEYFVPDYGWISADIVEADTPTGLGYGRWLTGLTARRLWLNQGREFQLAGDQAIERVNHMSIGYAEVDGKPVRLLPDGMLKPQLTRQVQFEEVADTPAESQTAN